jgi:hypothetical protein
LIHFIISTIPHLWGNPISLGKQWEDLWVGI